MPFLSSEEFDEQAHELYNAGEYDNALDMLQLGLMHFPEAVDLHVGLGYVRLAREEFVWANQSFEAALRLDPDHEDALVGLGETLLKFGRTDEALELFSQIDGMGLGEDMEIGLAIGRALYREGLFEESRRRLTELAVSHPNAAEVFAACAYTLHALGDSESAQRELRRALDLDPAFHEARIYLSHLLFESADHRGALNELERVPADEHWDPLSLWRVIELKCSINGFTEDDPALAPWRDCLAAMNSEPDDIDHLLAQVEAAFESAQCETATVGRSTHPAVARNQAESRTSGGIEAARHGDRPRVHRVSTVDGVVFTGTWEQIVSRMRDLLSHPDEPVSAFMVRASEQVRKLTGHELPCTDPEEFVRASARMGLLRIET